MSQKLYNENLIKEAVDIVIGDDGSRSAEVIGVIRMLKDQDESYKQQAASCKRQAVTETNKNK
jgi:hypothetical protein